MTVSLKNLEIFAVHTSAACVVISGTNVLNERKEKASLQISGGIKVLNLFR